MIRKKPMLAYPASDRPINYNEPVFIQPKLDGVRCLIQAEFTNVFKNLKVKAYSRTGKEWKNINHILQELVPFFDKYPDVILDGELYNHDFRNDFESIISMVRKQKPTREDMSKSRDNVQFHCYDIVNEDMCFDDRAEFIARHVPESYCVHHVDTDFTPSDHHSKHINGLHLIDGYEGSILRTNGVYQCKRSHSLRKLKNFQDAEARIEGWVEGKGKRIGTIGKFLAIDANGIRFGMPVMANYKYLQDNFKLMQGYVGKVATFTFFEKTKAGSYRHPLFKCIRNYE